MADGSGRAVRVAGNVAIAGVVVLGIAVVALLARPLAWRAMVASARTDQDVFGAMGLESAVNDGLTLVALAGVLAAVAGLAVALVRAWRWRGARPGPAPSWRPVWLMLGCLVAVVAVGVVAALAVGSGGRGRSVAFVVTGESLDPAARSAYERLFDPPSPGGTVLGTALLVMAGVLVVLLVRRLARTTA
jgi:hypothetical protein